MLQVDAVRKRYGAIEALAGCTFTAAPGRITGFLGPNGAGKTTAMRAVFGLVELDAGAVTWQGRPRPRGHRCSARGTRGLHLAVLHSGPRMRLREAWQEATPRPASRARPGRLLHH